MSNSLTQKELEVRYDALVREAQALTMIAPVMGPPGHVLGSGIENAAWQPLPKARPPETVQGIPAEQLLCVRLRTSDSDLLRQGFDIVAVRRTKSHWCVFALNKGEQVMLTDEIDAYPSDALIAKIRLLIG